MSIVSTNPYSAPFHLRILQRGQIMNAAHRALRSNKLGRQPFAPVEAERQDVPTLGHEIVVGKLQRQYATSLPRCFQNERGPGSL